MGNALNNYITCIWLIRPDATDFNEACRTFFLFWNKWLVNSTGSVLQKTKQLAELWTRREENGESFVWFENEAQYKSQEIGGTSSQWPHPSLSLILCFSPCWVCVFIHCIHGDRTPAVCQGCGAVGTHRWLRHGFCPWGFHVLHQYWST